MLLPGPGRFVTPQMCSSVPQRDTGVSECGLLDTEQASIYLHVSWELCFSLKPENPRYLVQYILKLRDFVPALLLLMQTLNRSRLRAAFQTVQLEGFKTGQTKAVSRRYVCTRFLA